mmetsp:Transcript_644/g.655  ORF Transcript_644/g.655 Transcript_644/m.655 type:complete len:413 (+) Transcript_644:139-1377(+)|eukprot:CAMPEP_0182417312 /NCGR_PEP_ID=MMETSP1167-20130531/1743_1 /TAXON_ID=2988 /ORGANISM="Mallomonas Sp, Strain CCMP3275" /LENGTH=412 /DNA_ID=CAMNT_0024590755 /DNA_START=78 /DNA_END=1316 /DNA_ORIENTATION=+
MIRSLSSSTAQQLVVLALGCLLSSPSVISADYGVDVSYPIHHALDPNSFQGVRHRESMEGCYKKYNKRACDSTDFQRIEMNKEQPATQHNYTELGFKKLRVPKEAWEPLKAFWEANRHRENPEVWPTGNVYVNHWVSPTTMVSVEDGKLRGYGPSLKKRVWDGVKPILEEWVGREIHPTSMYGIRVYHQDAILATHVDRLPLVTSCIINVDQDVDEPWPVEVYSHDGKAYNVTMEPGDMVLYESHTVLHGRPAPLKGRFFANIFVHFKPVDHEEMNELDFGQKNDQEEEEEEEERVFGGHYQEVEGEDEAQTDLHRAAQDGDLEEVTRIIKEQKHLLHATDSNQWQPIHEAARSGNIDVVKFLVQQGADVSAKTITGATPLWWARRALESGHEIIQYLEDMGADDGGDVSDL